MLWHRADGLEIVEQVIDPQPRFASCRVAGLDDLDIVFARFDFPRTSLVVSAAQGGSYSKGLRTLPELIDAIRSAIARSEDGHALVQTDMRANHNPRRMQTIGRAAEALAGRLSRHCPKCGSYGWGLVDVDCGLPCAACGTPTTLVKHEIHGCPACGHTVRHGRGDGVCAADPGNCLHCNP
ncbi:DUF6671 family protein [Devosia sp.]|uniref:DUF6671 family protein n=1 Tax=Devosia sp. TaxID=1871048 RepID=UPI002F1A0A71